MEIPESGVQNYISKMQSYVANVAITPSALRGQGGAGYVSEARKFLACIEMSPLANLDVSEYPKWLEEKTRLLMTKFQNKRRWGAARKSINIFMTMASLNTVLRRAYALERLEDVLEVPLDRVVAENLGEFAKEDSPKWDSITRLDPVTSEKYQQIALRMAKKKEIPRGQLDVVLWEPTPS